MGLEQYASGKPIAIMDLGTYDRDTYVWNPALWAFVTVQPKAFNPMEDTYTFARYIAPRLDIKKFFAYGDSSDRRSYRYSILKQEIMQEEGIEWIEIPKMKF